MPKIFQGGGEEVLWVDSILGGYNPPRTLCLFAQLLSFFKYVIELPFFFPTVYNMYVTKLYGSRGILALKRVVMTAGAHFPKFTKIDKKKRVITVHALLRRGHR